MDLRISFAIVDFPEPVVPKTAECLVTNLFTSTNAGIDSAFAIWNERKSTCAKCLKLEIKERKGKRKKNGFV